MLMLDICILSCNLLTESYSWLELYLRTSSENFH